jgi:hypothetical protein
MHPPDLALWPNAPAHIGLGLWKALPQGWWFVELGFIAVAWVFYYKKSRGAATYGGRPILLGIAILVFHALNSPWLSSY